MMALRRYPFRCRACHCRFHVSVLKKPARQPADDAVGPDDSKMV